MADYKKLYFLLFNKLTDIMEDIKEIQKETEDTIISSEETSIFFNNDNKNESWFFYKWNLKELL